jgi:NAD+ diphosphatase
LSIPDELHIRDPYDHQGIHGKIVITCGDRIVHEGSEGGYLWDYQALITLPVDESRYHFLGLYNGFQVFTVAMTGDEFAALSAVTSDLRRLMGGLSDALFRLLGRALQINEWYSVHRYCGCCGAVTQLVPNERALGCPSCHKVYYPRLAPCVMALVVRGEECLLARNAQWAVPRYSVVAGFIEPGESVEDAVHREVMEEVGVRVQNLEYIASQPWPFPGQLMLGFFAEHHSGDIQVDGVEIAEAHWYHYSDLPSIPGAYALSGQLIRHFIERCEQAR